MRRTGAHRRVEYTLNLATILAALVPDEVSGGISTVPLSCRPGYSALRLGRHHECRRGVERLARLQAETGKRLHLDIEPEPDCSLETTDEAIAFFERLRPHGGSHLDEHIQLCFDCCHCAVEYEDPIEAIDKLRRAGVRIGRVQLSSALTVEVPPSATEARAVVARLAPFADATYLHQVVEHDGDSVRRYPDLDVALASVTGANERSGAPGPPRASEPGGVQGSPPSKKEWRVHFHVPLFAAEYDGLHSSQDVVSTVIREARDRPFTEHLEIETYTWNVLPDGLKMEIGASIAREYRWVLGEWIS